ncbi:ankyrin repeat-containing domain protein [Amylocarpus encephaloides]|uniref:Ankyrin repeat-containing domain protein n=1 Tax=Amylocarpus encephaloides TaxID=45428 RepID=A0A9P7YC64_9HELO|nr:ankyrin repeat-containing domain protein [Amylocarpus encephaloides]
MAPKLTEDEIDDLLYFARIGDGAELKAFKEELCQREKASVTDLLASAKDEHSGTGVLHMAAANGYEGILHDLCKDLSNPAPQNPAMLAIINAQNNAGNTPLHWAALNGHLGSVKVLLEQGADPTLTNQKGHDAVYEAELNDKKEVVEWVLKEGGEGLEEGVSRETGEGDADDGAEEEMKIGENTNDDELSKKIGEQFGSMGMQDEKAKP